ncbi:MAG: hypothetical protein AAF596_07000 [Planctomycetota bacterium]
MTMLSELDRLLRRRTMSPAHRRQLLCHLSHFAAAADDDFSAFNDDDVNDWLDDLEAEKPRAPKTLRAYRASVLNGSCTAYAAGFVARRPATSNANALTMVAVCLTTKHLAWQNAIASILQSLGRLLPDRRFFSRDELGTYELQYTAGGFTGG